MYLLCHCYMIVLCHHYVMVFILYSLVLSYLLRILQPSHYLYITCYVLIHYLLCIDTLLVMYYLLCITCYVLSHITYVSLMYHLYKSLLLYVTTSLRHSPIYITCYISLPFFYYKYICFSLIFFLFFLFFPILFSCPSTLYGLLLPPPEYIESRNPISFLFLFLMLVMKLKNPLI